MPFTKGHKLAKGRPEGSKNVTTLLKEERRAIFEQEASKMWLETIHKLRPEYIADQFMGTAPIKVEQLQIKIDITPEKIEQINKIALDE